MSDSHGPYPLPDGWVWTTLGGTAEINPRRSLPAELTPDSEVTFLPMPAVDAFSGTITAPAVRPLCEVSRGFTYFQEEDVLFAKITPSMENGKAAIARGLTNGIGFGSTEFHVLRATEEVIPEWLFHYVRQVSFRADAKANFSGTAGQLRVPSDFIETYPLPLAPLPEQRRIVEVIETQFSRLDAAEAALRRVQSNLKRYRASVLKAACEGRLVPTEAELAATEGRTYEPASVLLERILAERRTKWQLANPKKTYKEPPAPDVETLPDLPEGWVWATVGQVAEVFSGQTPKGLNDQNEGGVIPWYRVSDMNTPGNETFMRESSVQLTSGIASNLGLHIRQVGTIIFPKRGGAIATNKKRVLSRPSAFDLNLMGIFPTQIEIHSYIWSWFKSIDLSSISDGSNVPQINHDDIALLPVPLPPIKEMKRIGVAVESELENVRVLVSSVEYSLRRCGRLRQSLLRSAFAGEI